MSRVPFNIRKQLVTPSSREEILRANSQTIRHEIEASQVDFDERTISLRSLRLARDTDLRKNNSVGGLGIRAAPRTSKGGAPC